MGEEIKTSNINSKQENKIREFLNISEFYGIDEILADIGKFYEADRAYIFRIDKEKGIGINTHEWCALNITHQKDNLQALPLEELRYFLNEVEKGDYVVNDVDKELDPSDPVYKIIKPQDINSLILAPLIIKGKLSGLIGVDNPRVYTEMNLLQSVLSVILSSKLEADEHVEEQRKKDEELKEQIAITEALSRSFRNVFVANLNDGTARVIRLANNYNVKAIRDVNGQTFSFDEVVDRWVREAVCEDDKQRVKETLNIKNLRELFSKQDKLVGSYRSFEDGVQHYYQYDFRRIANGENIVAGFQLIDDTVREQTARENKEKELVEAHLRDVKEHWEVINSLSTIYTNIFSVNLDNHKYETLSNNSAFKMKIEGIDDFDLAKERFLAYLNDEETIKQMGEFLNLDTLSFRLKNVNTISSDYKIPTNQWFQARFISKRRDDDGNVKEVLYVTRDITEEKNKDIEMNEKLKESLQLEQKQQEQLEDALKVARQASKAKSTFLNSMSHDIRTPMNAIIGFTSLALNNIDDKALVQDYLSKISTSSNHLLNLINDILDMSRIESGTVKLEEKPVYIPKLLADLRTMVNGLVDSKHLNLVIDSQNVIHKSVLTDELRLNQVLLNLVSNAIKFTNPGGDITICLIEKPCDISQYATYVFSIKDNGIGMSDEFLEHIFETFSREKSSTVSGIQGTGLGMAITKNIVDMMNGEIKVESQKGKGSLFTVTLNLRTTDMSSFETEEEKEEHFDYSDKHVLLVEDNELNREIATAILTKTGMDIDCASDGDEAVSIINEAPAEKYDLILMDIQMPKMDGYTATREIRTLKDNRKANIPIVAMTANAFEEDKRKACESGMNGHIIKPISIEQIYCVLNEIFSKKK